MEWKPFVDKVHPAPGPSRPRQSSRATGLRPPSPSHMPSSFCFESSSPSSSSVTADQPVSCATRETSQDECSYFRFVHWAAVKRNTYRFISSREKLQCPLYRCGKAFPDHEHMLLHLATCEHLPSREYWCYDHKCVERFDDMKCKRCTSHPSRRRRMLSRAKTFFSALGHKSRRGPDLPLDLDDAIMSAPPSYQASQHQSHQALNLDLPEKPELPSSTEILEIDSTEVDPVVNPQDLYLPELESVPLQSSMQWQPTPFVSTVGYDFSTAVPAYESLSASRPTFMGFPQAPQQIQPMPSPVPASTRSKNLSPSSSVRSTASTMSNISAISTSYSLWSTPSIASSGMETSYTSLSVDMIDPIGIPQNDDFESHISKRSRDPLDTISELPADMGLHELSTGDFVDFRNPFSDFDLNTTSVEPSYPKAISVQEKGPSPSTAQQSELYRSAIFQSETKSLVASAWDALQEHILSSQAKIKHLQCPLAEQFGMQSSQTIAHRGLASLRSILVGQPLTSPLEILSLAHVIYSFSLVVYGDGAIQRSSNIFAQSLLYSTWLIEEEQAQFREVAVAIWRPSDMDDDQLNMLMPRQSYDLHTKASNDRKGKSRATNQDIKDDALISAAQNFLDELEATVVLGSSFDAHAAELRAKHADADMHGTAQMSDLTNVLTELAHRFQEFDDLTAQLNKVSRSVTNSVLRSTRRLELEALHAGRNCIVNPSDYFDKYAPLVRNLCGPIYELEGNVRFLSRQECYALGISLSEALIKELETEPLDCDTVSNDGSDPVAFLTSFPTTWCNDPMEAPPETQPLFSMDLELFDVPPVSDSHVTGNAMATTDNAAPTTSTPLSRSPSSASSDYTTKSQTLSSTTTASPQQQSAQQQKIEAEAGCELCDYKPKGSPQWFRGSMAKHMKIKHSNEPPVIYRCPFPGCNSAFRSRPDNLKQHQYEKNHFVEGEERVSKRPSKRKRVS